MRNSRPERRLDTLLDLDGQVFVLDPQGEYWVKMEVHRVAPSPERPHGLKYSLTLHDAAGRRLVGFDNAHSVRRSARPGGRSRTLNHTHRLGTARPYCYEDAVTLLKDFWTEVDRVLREKGVLP
jgi:hypothetical protein